MTVENQLMNLRKGGHVLLDAIGAAAFKVTQGKATADHGGQPAPGMLLDLEGRLNKTSTRYVGRFLMTPGQAAELVNRVVFAVHSSGDADIIAAFVEHLDLGGSDEGEDHPAG